MPVICQQFEAVRIQKFIIIQCNYRWLFLRHSLAAHSQPTREYYRKNSRVRFDEFVSRKCESSAKFGIIRFSYSYGLMCDIVG